MRAIDEPRDLCDVCDVCGANDWIPIVYGFPAGELFEKAGRGEVSLGGCMVTDDQPSLRCGVCGADQ
ncbi:hypothetical protein [Naasia lichenicola]|uniref:Uncharacterized protein n=1 Tax=Naasia lichenicola TaxID=2565933 RepID=A0A4S4FTZ9_9MICO|nr:hypothetical protein [Naasia lichenicola]THG33255.1 hypothetical protein E6C64_02575 [Naasia lichenicola]